MILSRLIQSSLPTDASVLETAISALERKIRTLENSSVSWEHRLPWFTAMVAIGVVAELWVITREYREEREFWRRGTIRSPEKPSISKYAIEVLSVVLITAGIVGELLVGIKITSINGTLRIKNAELRSKSDQVVALLNTETEQLRNDAEAARLARVKIEASVAWRHLTKKQQEEIGFRLGHRFSGQAVGLAYFAGDTETQWFATDIAEALRAAHTLHVFRPAGLLLQPIERAPTGVIVQSTDRSRSLADAIVQQLKRYGFDATSQTIQSRGSNSAPEVYVVVEPRPRGPQGEFKLAAQRHDNEGKRPAPTLPSPGER